MSRKRSLLFFWWTHCKINIWQYHKTIRNKHICRRFYFVSSLISNITLYLRNVWKHQTRCTYTVVVFYRCRVSVWGFADKWSLNIHFITGQWQKPWNRFCFWSFLAWFPGSTSMTSNSHFSLWLTKTDERMRWLLARKQTALHQDYFCLANLTFLYC